MTMIRRIRIRIQRFWDIMTNKEWTQAILDADKGDTVPFEFTFMIDKSEIKDLLQQRIKKHDNTIKYNTEIESFSPAQSIKAWIQTEEILWFAKQLNIDLEMEDDDQ